HAGCDDPPASLPRYEATVPGRPPPLRHCRGADAGAQAQRQGQGGSGCAGGRALDPGPLARPDLFQPGRAEPGDWRTAERPERTANEASGTIPPRTLRRAGPTGSQTPPQTTL